MRILSVRAPWWWFIFHAGKDIENRDWKWPPSYRGPLLIHASKTIIKRDVREDFEAGRRIVSQLGYSYSGPVVNGETFQAVAGCIVGRVDLVDVVTESASPWFFGRLGFVLRNPMLLKPIPFKAGLGLLEVPIEVLSEIRP